MNSVNYTQPGLARVADVLVMPEAGIAAVVALLDAARTAIKIKMFTFDSPALIAASGRAVGRGVHVQVMLNPQRSSGSRANDRTLDELTGFGVAVKWTSPDFAVTHEKSMVLDGRRALIGTFNFVDKYFTLTRDYGLLIDDGAVVAQVAACFDADWERRAFQLPHDSPLVLSNFNARQATASVIDSARETLRIQHPKYSDMAILDRLLRARARGVHVHLLCGGHHGISDSDKLDTYSALRSLRRAGVQIRRQHQLRLHAKLLIADGKRGMLGSMNIDRSAYDLRREMGIVFTDEAVLHRLRERFHRDWKEAKHYDPPDPLAPEPPPEADPPAHDAVGHDPALMHD